MNLYGVLKVKLYGSPTALEFIHDIVFSYFFPLIWLEVNSHIY